MNGYVYFAREGETGHIKIGRAQKPDRRVQTLQTGCPKDLYLLAVIPSYNCEHLEKIWQENYKEINVRGEWFLPHENLLNAITEQTIENSTGMLSLDLTPEQYYYQLGKEHGRRDTHLSVFKQIKKGILNSSRISFTEFCQKTGIPFEDVISA